VFAHLRQANSGCIKGVVDPHPFKRVIDGKTWLFGHNGVIPKETLMQLIGPEYLKENPPEVCSENPPDTWIDSELYFIFLLKMIEENANDVIGGIKAAVTQLNAFLAQEKKGLNFFLTDGQTVWAYRNGMSLHYRYSQAEGFTVIASDKGSGSWSGVEDNELVVVFGNLAPQVTKIP
jgi:glutamine amidotransferase